MRKTMTVLGLAALIVALVGCTPEEKSIYESVNANRAFWGVPALKWEEGAYAKAQAWSAHMADEGELSHSKPISSNLRPDVRFTVLGENVAVAPSPEIAADELAHSPDHFRNMVDKRFDRMAVGVVKRGDAYWVTEIFLG